MPSTTRVITIGGQSMAPGAVTVPTPSLKYWRIQRALLQQELADRAGVGLLSVYRGERGRPLRLNIVRKLAAALDIDPPTLMAQPPAS